MKLDLKDTPQGRDGYSVFFVTSTGYILSKNQIQLWMDKIKWTDHKVYQDSQKLKTFSEC